MEIQCNPSCNQPNISSPNDCSQSFLETPFTPNIQQLEIIRKRKELKQKTNEYIKKSPHIIMTSRWNQKTWEENCEYRRMNPQIGCIYCSPTMISQEIPKDATMFILEMNNDINRIMGIGLVRNRHVLNKYFVYDNGRYNRFVYISKTRIDRKDMKPDEEQIMKVFDILCFMGNTHMKRGQGLKAFPREMLYKISQKKDLVEFITNMFKSRNTKEHSK
jgi:hypothetical protein